MSEPIVSFLLQYGLPGLAIMGLWILLQNEKKANADREQIWLNREKLWHETEKQERDTLIRTIERNTEVLTQIQMEARSHELEVHSSQN